MHPTPIWDLEALRNYIGQREETEGYLTEATNSIGRMNLICDFHLQHAKEALKGFSTNAQDIEFVRMMLDFGPERHVAEQQALSVEAHLLAAMHGVRASFDVFSQLVNGLQLNNQYSPERCNIHMAERALKPSRLKTDLASTLSSYDFRYVAGFVNATKHRHMVRSKFSADFVLDKAGIRVAGFELMGSTYKEEWAYDVLKRVFDLKNQITLCGHSLNAVLGLPEPPTNSRS